MSQLITTLLFRKIALVQANGSLKSSGTPFWFSSLHRVHKNTLLPWPSNYSQNLTNFSLLPPPPPGLSLTWISTAFLIGIPISILAPQVYSPRSSRSRPFQNVIQIITLLCLKSFRGSPFSQSKSEWLARAFWICSLALIHSTIVNTSLLFISLACLPWLSVCTFLLSEMLFFPLLTTT